MDLRTFLRLLCFLALALQRATAKNVVSTVLEKFLTDLPSRNVSVEDIALGTNRLSGVHVWLPAGLEKQVDDEGRLGFKLKLNVSQILVAGNYEFQNLDIPGLFPLFGKGKFSIDLEEIYLHMIMRATPSFVEDKTDISILKFDLSLGNSTILFRNLMDDPHVADFLNEMLSSLLPDFVKIFHKQLIADLQPLIDHFGHEIIKCIKKELKSGKIEECIRNITLPNPPPTLQFTKLTKHN